MTNKTLGRGLSAFLSTPQNESDDQVIKIDVQLIKPNPYQPRNFFDEEQLQSLASSIKRKGVLQPILVQKLPDDSYQLIAGERRLRASKLAGLSEIPAIVTNLEKEEQLEVAILENVQRENLNPIEEAESYRRLIDEFHHTQDELSNIIGKSRSHIANILRLLNLPEDVQTFVREGKLTFGHARALIGSKDASRIAQQVIRSKLNVRDTENLIQSARSRITTYADPEIVNLAHQISSLIGLNVNIKIKGKGGTIEINFSDFEQLDSFVRKLNG
ncbi:MAG: ParB/RepB/Spo0J family partition protein [Alphaproteobacteria bacterium]|nr:ParB/RepB/Spo0J family partition protein [Alphaproteobacteria bacterium]